MIYVRQDMEGRVFWFHVMQLLNGRYQRELSENHGTAQRASCKAGFSWQPLRRTTQGVSRTGDDVAG